MASSTNTTSIVLNWTAAGGANSTGQEVHRSLRGANSYSSIASLGASATTYTDTTALADVEYDFKIVNICTTGGPTDSGRVNVISITCPTATTVATGLIITGEYGDTFNDVTYTDIQLLNASEDLIQTYDTSSTPVGPGNYAFTDAGVDYNTAYIVRLRVETALGSTKNCDFAISTGAAPACDAPTGLTVSVAS